MTWLLSEHARSGRRSVRYERACDAPVHVPRPISASRNSVVRTAPTDNASCPCGALASTTLFGRHKQQHSRGRSGGVAATRTTLKKSRKHDEGRLARPLERALAKKRRGSDGARSHETRGVRGRTSPCGTTETLAPKFATKCRYKSRKTRLSLSGPVTPPKSLELYLGRRTG